ncbi:MAG: CDP-alcohol phosphatidyltransferase family protein [Pseudomonadales bacterium]|nr:CDP-alcohol phosphatidyltransferase family protein [Pseudomonadales bacterium]
MQWSLLPNAITIFRIVLIIPVVSALLSEDFLAALLLFFIAGASDGLDGFLARRYDWSSEFGALVDPLADKILLVFTYIALAIIGIFPIWFVVIVVARDVLVLGGVVFYSLFWEPVKGRPTLMGKACTFVQIGFGLITVFQLAVVALPSWVQTGGIYIVVVLCFISGAQYAWIGVTKVREVNLEARNS